MSGDEDLSTSAASSSSSTDSTASGNRDFSSISAPQDFPSEPVRQGSLFEPVKHHAETASKLATWLVGILGGSVGLYFILLAILAACSAVESTKQLTTAFTAWLPVISGLVGGAITYYFTRDANS
ncbi:hypothetical protein [Tuwongella immobilis]|uniref:hypothetical protein n=1 Tax=Tuwongella immobilis TaxID=692036 RepID=UPI0013A6A6F7|nr:hypothetical protein [Tuwongella immobilis]